LAIFLYKMLLNALQTAQQLDYAQLADEIHKMLLQGGIEAPPRLVQSLPGGASLFAMPATDGRLAITKLITYTPSNAARGLPTIQGDVIVLEVQTGRRIALLDGPTVTARRTAAVSLLAAQCLAPQWRNTFEPLLIIGAGVQGRAHLEAFAQTSAQGLGVQEVWIASRSLGSAQLLAAHAKALGLRTRVLESAQEISQAAQHCPLIVTATPAAEIVLTHPPRDDAFIAAVGAFKPSMREIAPSAVQHIARTGRIVVDTPDAQHEAGDLLQAGVDVSQCADLETIVKQPHITPTGTTGTTGTTGPTLFKSCGWAGWDLAAARLACVAL
jgi:1-piperideine-2-carboxylate/1-pyrroline-2-carboxylate reductase [NAD(P)H]